MFTFVPKVNPGGTGTCVVLRQEVPTSTVAQDTVDSGIMFIHTIYSNANLTNESEIYRENLMQPARPYHETRYG